MTRAAPILRLAALAVAALIGCGDPGSAAAQQSAQPSDLHMPEPASTGAPVALNQSIRAAQQAKAQGRPVKADNWMIVAAHPLAAKAGAKVLDNGGNAIDAMVAAQMVLGLVEPQSSGLGGGGFLVYFDAAKGQLATLDGRETAPQAATPRLFLDDSGAPLRFFDAVVGGRSVGVPGTPALMQAAHQRWGQHPWAGLLQPATDLARSGFAVSPRLAQLVQADAAHLAQDPGAAAYFLPGGAPLQSGAWLRNPAYADTLDLLARQGAHAFYNGPIARDIAAAVQQAPNNPGLLTATDLALYRVKDRPPLCAAFRSYDICGIGPPSSGTVAVGQILGMLDGIDLGHDPMDPHTRRRIGQATRLAFADRARFLADDDFVPVPVQGLLDPGYLAQRARLIEGALASEEVFPGRPAFDHAQLRGDDASLELPSTTHLSIVDAAGNVASLTSTIENGFGSRLMVRGFLLNNELTDFSFKTHNKGRPIANRVAPGKRPRSSMAPLIVLQGGQPVLAIGSPGGSAIIPYVAQTLIAHLVWGLDIQSAIALPHAINRFGPYQLEAGTAAETLAPALSAMGYQIQTRHLTSGLHAISISETLQGGADPRREGIALGR